MRHLLNPLDFSVEETNELLTLTFVMAKNWLLFSMNQVQEPVLALNPLC